MTTKISIIGSGFGMYGLLPAFSKINDCKVVSICGKNSDRMMKFCKKFHINHYINWKEMLEKEKPNAVAIAIIPIYQYEIAKYALENGIAVFAEKPLTASYETSLELCNLANDTGLPNMMDFIFPEIPEWREAKKILDDGLINQIKNISVNWTFLSYELKHNITSWKSEIQKGGGAISFYFSHVFYYLEYFLGKINNLNCEFSSSNFSNRENSMINMIVSFENGISGNISLDISSSKEQNHIIKFNDKNIQMILKNISNNHFENFELILNDERKTKKQSLTKKPHFSIDDEFDDSRVNLVESIANRFIHWCNTGKPSKPDFNDGLRVQKLIEKARNSKGNLIE